MGTTDLERSLALAYDARPEKPPKRFWPGKAYVRQRGAHRRGRRHHSPIPWRRLLRSLDRLPRRRNEAEYPDRARYAAVSAEEANEAVETAQRALDASTR